METKISLVTKLLEKQRALNLTDSAFSKKLGISRQLWSAIKSGRKGSSLKLFQGVMRELPEFTLDVMSEMKRS